MPIRKIAGATYELRRSDGPDPQGVWTPANAATADDTVRRQALFRHVAAADILDQVKASYPYIDMSTVYRTLDMLKQMRLISETHMGGDQHSYEWIERDRHHHLVCLECDGVIQLDDRFVGALGSEIMESYGFEADIDHLALFGMSGVPSEGGRPPGYDTMLSMGAQVHGGRF